MKYNGLNIICDSDITMTGQLIGHSLSEVINNQQDQIDSLRSNVKWIYKYGGVGSGSGSGSGTSDSDSLKYLVEIDNTSYVNNSEVNFGKLGIYHLSLKLFKIQGRTFDVKITYPTENGILLILRKILPTSNPEITETLDLQVNGLLYVGISDDEGNVVVYNLNYIVTAYSFTLNYVYQDHSLYYPVDNNIYVNEIKLKGLLIDFHSIIASDFEPGTARYTYTDWSGLTYEFELTRGSNHIYLDPGIDITDENAGNYTFLVQPHITLEGETDPEVIPELKLQDNLIPTNCYLKIVSDGILYNSNTVVNPSTYYLGAIAFKITPYQGPLDMTSTYYFEIQVDGLPYETMYSQLEDQTTYTLDIIVQDEGWHSVKFTIRRKNEVYETTLYFYAISPLGSFSWYPTVDNIKILPSISYKHKYNYTIKEDNTYLIAGFKATELITRTTQLSLTTHVLNINEKDYQTHDLLIAFGILYNPLNLDDLPILKLTSCDGNYFITIYLNKVIIKDLNANIYLPKEGFHLLTIYKRALRQKGNGKEYEWNIYIDGVLESALSSPDSGLECWLTLTVYNLILSINYIELSYFLHTNVGNNVNDYSAFIINPKLSRTYFNDLDILYHFYSYKLTYYPDSISDSFKAAYTLASSCFTDYTTNRVRTDGLTITDIATNIDIPVLLLHYIEPKNSLILDFTSDGEAFLEWMESSYDVKDKPAEINWGFNVDVYYSPGKKSLNKVLLNDDALFKLYLQGTSTMIYLSKNYDLVLETIEGSESTYLYTPNYSPNDSSTFLPEKRFTIKADVVDSSHSNNATIGKFVNSVCTLFAGAKLNSGTVYEDYIKNTLLGFPILLFILNSYYKNATTDIPTNDYYFLGISSFNLGRDSEFNLGYKDLRLLPETLTEGMLIVSIPNLKSLSDGTTLYADSYLSNFGVAEILENKNYFDFSLYDDSILFLIPSNEKDTDYMFDKMKSNQIDILKNALRTLVESVAKSGGYVYDTLGKNMLEGTVEDPAYSYTVGYKHKIPLNLVGNYKKQLKRVTDGSKSIFSFKSDTEIKGEVYNLLNTLIADSTDPNNIIIPTVDYKSLSEYYVICMALGLLDSVVKNLNVKTWNNKTFYTAFYDMDTSLGKDNAGNNSNYISFSDYWEPQEDEKSGFSVLQQAKSYKDWFDPDVMGFDIPSTYLFALVKYGYHILNDSESSLKDWYPNNLWARMRLGKDSLPNWSAPTGTNFNHIGCLRNADYFVLNYYGGYLKNVPDCFFNLNYRKKYLIFKDGLYEGEAFKKFSGKRIHYVKDWLNNRLHLLDLYFNLPNVNDPILQYDLEAKLWNVVPNLNYISLDSSFIDQSNKDIIVLQNIFSANSSVKYSTDVKLIFTADDYSPICTSGETVGRYIAKDKNTQYRFEFASAGKSLSLGGSGNWLTVSDINSVIQGTLLYIHSDKLTTLKGTSNPYPVVPPLACTSWNLRMPALEEVILTHNEYSGELVFTSNEDIAWSNLKSINISGSKLGLKLSSVPVQYVNASNVISNNNLTITNCALLNLLNYHKSRFNALQVVYPLRNSSVDTTNVSFAENMVYNSTSKTFVSGTNSNFVLCNTLQVTCSTKNGKIYIGGLQYTLNNQDNGLLEITLSGYTHIYINNCPFIKSIVIDDPETVLVLQVIESASRAEYFSINSSIPNVVDLTLFKNLESLKLNRTKKFNIAKLCDGLKLDASAFNETNLKYLDGNKIKLGNSNLFSWSGFTLRKSDTTTLCNFDFTGVTSLASVFYASAVNLETFKEFNNTYRNSLKNITNTSSTWGNCGQIKYSVDDLLSDYLSGKCSIDLSMYSGVTNANGMFDYSGIKTVHPNMLNGFGASSFSANYMFNFGRTNNTEEIVLPYDWLNHVSSKITNFSNHSEHTTFKFVTYDNNKKQLVTEKTIIPSKIFGSNPIKLKSIVNWNLSSEHTLNIGNDLTKFKALSEITKSFCKCNGSGLNYTDSTTGAQVGFLYEIPNVVVKGSFGFLNWDNIKVSYDNFINWEKAPNIFLYIQGWDDPQHVFAFKKTIGSIDNFWNILVTLLLNHKYPQLCHVFENCIVLEVLELDIESLFDYLSSDDPDDLNTSITNISYLFYNMRLVNSDIDRSWDWDWNIFKKLPNVTVLRYTFYKMFFNGGLPFNLFNRRLVNNKTVYIIKGDASSKATLYSHTYTNKITDLYYTFYGCLFYTKSFVGFEKSYNKDDMNSPNFIEYIVDGVVSHPTTYYESSSSLAVLKLVTNPDYDDFDLEAGYDSTVNTICGVPGSAPLDYQNHPIYITGALLPPDIFYACSLDANLLYCFADSNIEGYIPDNLFKNNCKLPRLLNFIKNVIILPKKMYNNYLYSSTLSEAFDLYYYIGSEFVNSSDLSNSFNCHICLPYRNYTILGLTTEDSIPMRSLYVFCLSDSFTQGRNFQDMLPRLIRSLTNSEEIMCAGNWRTNILLNPMYNRTSEYDLEYTEHDYTYDSDTGEYKDSDGNIVNSRPSVRVLGELGFKSDEPSATYDKLINYLWVLFGYKHMLSSETNLSTLNRSSSSNWILELGYQGDFGVSPEILLPFMSRTYLNSILISPMLTNVITDNSGSKLVTINRDSSSIPIKKGCIVNFTDSIASHYRNSKQSKILSINFTD